MSYATLERVQGLIAGVLTLTPSTFPSTSQATALIDEVSNEIDGVLAAASVAVPVSTPSYFVESLALLNAYGAAAMVIKSALPESTGPGESPAWAFWESRYRAGLKRIEDGKIPAELAAGGGDVDPSGYFTAYPDAEAVAGEDLGELEGAPSFSVGDEW